MNKQKKMKRRITVLSWVVTVILGMVLLGQIGSISSDINRLDWAGVWNLSLQETSLHRLAKEELPLDSNPGYEYYSLVLKMTNNSSKPARCEYEMEVGAAEGESRAVRRYWSRNQGRLRMEPVIPVGGTGKMSMILEVDPDRLTGTKVQLGYNDWGDHIEELGIVDLADAQ